MLKSAFLKHPFTLSVLGAFVGTVITAAVLWLGWTLYVDHQNLQALVQIRMQQVQQAQGAGK